MKERPRVALVFTTHPTRLRRRLVGLALAVGTAAFVGRVGARSSGGFFGLFLTQWDPAEPRGLPTWLASILFLAASYTSLLARRAGDAPAIRRGWLGLSLAFFGLSFDQFTGFHERLLDSEGVFTSQTFNWVFAEAILLVLVGIALVPFLAALPRRLSLALAVAGGVYVTGALGFEEVAALAGGWSLEGSVLHDIAIALETTFELSGAGLYVSASYRYAYDAVRGESVGRP